MAFAFALQATKALLIAIIDGRHARHGEQDGRGHDGTGTAHLGGDAGHVVVADEGLRHEGFAHLRVPAQGPVQFPEVALLDRTPGGFPEFVFGNGVELAGVDEAGVVAVDDLAEEEGIGKFLPHAAGDLAPEAAGHVVGHVQPPAGNAAAQPVQHHVHHQLGHLGLAVVEVGELAVAFPALYVAVFVALGQFLDARVAGCHVVEHAIEHHAQAALAAGGHEVVEVGIVAQAGIDAEVVQRVVAVRHRFEDRPEQQPGAAQLHHVIQPGFQPGQAMAGIVAGAVMNGGAQGTQRIHMPPDGIVEQGHAALQSSCFTSGQYSPRGRISPAIPVQYRGRGTSETPVPLLQDTGLSHWAVQTHGDEPGTPETQPRVRCWLRCPQRRRSLHAHP